MSSDSELSDTDLGVLRDVMKLPVKTVLPESKEGDRPKRTIKLTTKIRETKEILKPCAPSTSPSKIYMKSFMQLNSEIFLRQPYFLNSRYLVQTMDPFRSDVKA